MRKRPIWLGSILNFGENYAPLALKEQLYKFDYQQLKSKYLDAAKATKTNDQFYDLMFQFVAEFKDAHTSASLTNSSLPNRAQVAFLGFNGSRNGDQLIVKSLLPTITKVSAFPIHVGDRITKFNGKKLSEVIKTEQLKYRDIGNFEGNLTYFMNRIFTRVSTSNGLPTEKDVVLTLDKGGKEVNVTLPWVIKDLAQFKEEQAKASAAPKKAEAHSENFMMVSDDQSAALFKFNFIGFDGRVQTPYETLQKVMAGAKNSLHQRFSDGFQFMDNIAQWTPVTEGILGAAAPAKETPMEALAKQRSILTKAIYLSESKTYPAYIAPIDVLDKDGKKTGYKKSIGYIYVDTFSPGDADEALKEFQKTISAMQSIGVRDLIIDTINNGGGSLVLGMKMAQALTNKPVEMPKMQFRISDTWLDEFEGDSLSGNSDAEKEYSRRMFVDLMAQRKAGKLLSEPYPADVLSPFDIKPNEETQPIRTVLLINEMCASMCDIFAGILQDNKMAVIMGANSMGAGGNVVDHKEAPNSHLELRQTESLIIRKDGSYLENAGVKPDIALPVNEAEKDRYAPVIRKAVELLGMTDLIPSAPAPKPATEIKPTDAKPAEAAPVKTADMN